MLILEAFLLLAFLAFVCEWIDASLGMGYGTILSPVLILFGLPPLLIVPSILLTQAIGGFSASIFHHKYHNVAFNINSKAKNPFYALKRLKEKGIRYCLNKGISEDLKTVFIITSLGIIATIAAAFIAIGISKTALSIYIGALVLVMGLFLLSGITFRYSTKKMMLVGVISAFNKGMSGGGFGPVVTGGQMVLGQKHKKAIGCTTAAEVPICIAGFLTYLIFKGITEFDLIYALGAGAIFGGMLGPLTTKTIDKNLLKKIVTVLLIALGALTLLKVFGIISLNISV